MSSGTWYHCSLKPIGRSAGRSAIACAAYRTGSCLEDQHYGAVRDFSRKKDVLHSFTVAPAGAPAWATEVEALWNAVEKREKRKDSQLAFEWETALPASLTDDERQAIAHQFADWLVGEYSNAVTVGIHSGGDRGNGLNDHMHVMMTTRSIDECGWGDKLRQFNVRAGSKNPEVERVREKVAEIINDALEDAGSDERVDHRSFRARGLEYEGTKHLGPQTFGLERAGFPTERGDINRSIIEARLIEQEALMPVITAEVERELAARFGDPDPSAEALRAETERVDRLIEEARSGTPIDEDIVQEATAGREPIPEDPAVAGRNPPPPPRGWWSRMKRIAASFLDFLHDEGGGDAEPENHQPGFIKAILSEGVQAGKTFAERVRGRGRDIWKNQRGSVPDTPFDAMFEAMENGELETDDTPEPDVPQPDGPDLD